MMMMIPPIATPYSFLTWGKFFTLRVLNFWSWEIFLTPDKKKRSGCRRCLERKLLKQWVEGKGESVDLDGSIEAYKTYCLPCREEFDKGRFP